MTWNIRNERSEAELGFVPDADIILSDTRKVIQTEGFWEVDLRLRGEFPTKAEARAYIDAAVSLAQGIS